MVIEAHLPRSQARPRDHHGTGEAIVQSTQCLGGYRGESQANLRFNRAKLSLEEIPREFS